MRYIDQDRNINLMRCYAVFRNALFLIPVILLFYREQLGLSFQQFVLGEVVFSVAILLMEVPSGWLADVWQRKHVLALGIVLLIAGWSLLLVKGGFAWAVAAQAVIGLGISLCSGTDSAIIYETLAETGRESAFRRQAGLGGGLAFYALAVAGLIGGWMYTHHPYWPLYAVLAMQVAALIAVLFLREPVRARRSVEKHPLHDMAITVHEAFIKRRDLGLLILVAALLFGSTQYSGWAQQQYWLTMKLSPQVCGMLAALAWLLAGLSAHWGHHIEHSLGYKRAFAGIWLALCAAWVIAGVHLGWLGIGGLFLGSMSWAVGWPALQDAINQQIGSERRATIVSTASLMIRLAFMPIGALASHVADQHGVQSSLLVLAAFHIGLGLLVGTTMFVLKRRKSAP